jgi:predicted amidohydrolase YtcJ
VWLFHGGRILDARRVGNVFRERSTRRVPRSGGRADRKRYSEAVLVRGDRIEAVGLVDRLRRAAGRKAHAVDLRGGTLTPGFVDSHVHLLTWIRSQGDVWIARQDPEALEEAARTARARTPDGVWVTLRGWIPREWPRELRLRDTLDRVCPDRPLLLHAVDGHSYWANSAALRAAGVTAQTSDPPGGKLDREPGGEPSGILSEEARGLISPYVRRARSPEEDLARAIRRMHALGVTGAHDFDRNEVWGAAQALDLRGELPFRLLLSVPARRLEAAGTMELRSGWGNERLRVGPVKFFADGTLGSGTALLEEEYDDDTSTGMEVVSRAELADRCVRARKAGLTVAIHAIGDRAVRNALDAIQTAIQSGSFPLPPRIEHIQLAREDDLPRFRQLGVLASVQPLHQVTDRALARRKWGARTARSYAYRSLERSGATLLFGSDAPFDLPGPLLAIQAALLRRRADEPDAEAFHPEQRLGLARALRAHLEDPNRMAGWCTPLGRIDQGWGADLVQFDHDLLELEPQDLHRARVCGVWVAGARVFGKSR